MVGKKLSLRKLKIAKLSNSNVIKGGSQENVAIGYNETENLTQKCDLTAIGPTQTTNQGPTRGLNCF